MCQIYGRKVKRGVSMEMREEWNIFSELSSVNSYFLQSILISIIHTHLQRVIKAGDKQALAKVSYWLSGWAVAPWATTGDGVLRGSILTTPVHSAVVLSSHPACTQCWLQPTQSADIKANTKELAKHGPNHPNLTFARLFVGIVSFTRLCNCPAHGIQNVNPR